MLYGKCGLNVQAAVSDQLYKHLEVVTPGDLDGYANKLIQAGSTFEFLKYSDFPFSSADSFNPGEHMNTVVHRSRLSRFCKLRSQ